MNDFQKIVDKRILKRYKSVIYFLVTETNNILYMSTAAAELHLCEESMEHSDMSMLFDETNFLLFKEFQAKLEVGGNIRFSVMLSQGQPMMCVLYKTKKDENIVYDCFFLTNNTSDCAFCDNFLDDFSLITEMETNLIYMRSIDMLDIPMVFTEDDFIRFGNTAFSNALSFRKSIVHSTRLSKFASKVSRDALLASETKTYNGEATAAMPMAFPTQNNDTFVANVITTPLYVNGEIPMACSVLIDYKEAQREHELLGLYAELIALVRDNIFIINDEQELIFANESFTTNYGFSVQEPLLLKEMWTKDVNSEISFSEHILPALQKTGSYTTCTQLRSVDGVYHPVEINIVLLKNISGGVRTHYGVHIKDITRRLEIERLFYQQKNLDYLTGMSNTTHFIANLEEKLNACKNGNTKVSLMMFDMSNYVEVFQEFGSEMANSVLKMVALRAKSYVGDIENIARVGESRFVAIFEAKDESELVAYLEGFMAIMDWPLVYENYDFPITVCVGAGTYPDNAIVPLGLYGFVRELMRRARSEKRSAFAYHTSNGGYTVKSHTNSLEMDIELALKNDEFRVYYQPIASVQTQEIIRYEALMRWESPTFGTLMPGAFLRAAENAKLTVPIGYRIIEIICADIKSCIDNDCFFKKMSINLTMNQLHDRNLPNFMDSMLKKYGLHISMFEFEYSNIVAALYPQGIDDSIKWLASNGFTVCVDNFGFGVPSIEEIKTNSISRITIDRTLIKRIAIDKNMNQKVAELIEKAHTNHIVTMAQGVQTEEQLNILKEMGCDTYAGFLLGRPKIGTSV